MIFFSLLHPSATHECPKKISVESVQPFGRLSGTYIYECLVFLITYIWKCVNLHRSANCILCIPILCILVSLFPGMYALYPLYPQHLFSFSKIYDVSKAIIAGKQPFNGFRSDSYIHIHTLEIPRTYFIFPLHKYTHLCNI